MSASGRNDNVGSAGEEEEESADAKIERLTTEIDELKASLIGVPELSDEWFRIKTDIKEKDTERLLLIEKKRCDDVVKEYFEENPHVLEAASECPVCLDKMWDGSALTRFVCCGNQICKKCEPKGESGFKTCPICRKEAPRSVAESLSIMKEKADLGIAWAQAEVGQHYLYGRFGMPEDMEKALPLLSEAAEKGSTRAKGLLGEYYCGIEKYEEARRWHETAAAEGGIKSLFRLGVMMKHGHVYGFDENEETRAEAFRFITISAVLLEGFFNRPAVELSHFLDTSLYTVILHYLRPAVEGGNTTVGVMDYYALGLFIVGLYYYGESENAIFAPGHSVVPEALFWYRRSDHARRPGDGHSVFVQMERTIRESCANCMLPLGHGSKMCCVECKAAYYCDRDCQMAHWKAGHKKDCVRKLKKKLKAAGAL